MLTKEAIDALAEAQSILAADTAMSGAINQGPGDGLVALPTNYTVHDLEKALPFRRRPRGAMTTSVLGDFHNYLTKHLEAGAAVFVDQKTMSATAVLNLGTPAAPGHADNTAVLGLKMTAAYKALAHITGNGARSQVTIAEFLEDWTANIKCQVQGDGEEEEATDLPVRRAVAAVRKITIEGMRTLENEEKNLSASRSLIEQVQVKNQATMPTRITFTCEPYLGLRTRDFHMRLSVITMGDKPSLALRVVNLEKHEEEMAEELASLVRSQVGALVPVHIGSYSPSK